jgi:hypothetical protein
MNRGERRRVGKELDKIMKKAPDNCTLCGAPFPHNSRTFGGAIANGKVHLVGQCCAARLAVVILQGVYMNRHADAIPMPRNGMVPPSQLSAEEIEQNFTRIQAAYAELDGIADQAARRAGLPTDSKGSVVLGDHPWKQDDAEWFEARPDRSHRLREPFDGEVDATFGGRLPPAPPGHRVVIIIRQVEPGRRVRLPFFANNEVPVPDDEQILHGLFDSIGQQTEGAISARQVAERARQLTSRGALWQQ